MLTPLPGEADTQEREDLLQGLGRGGSCYSVRSSDRQHPRHLGTC